MANGGDLQAGDLQAHEATYSRVIGMLKIGTIVAVAVAALVIWLIA